MRYNNKTQFQVALKELVFAPNFGENDSRVRLRSYYDDETGKWLDYRIVKDNDKRLDIIDFGEKEIKLILQCFKEANKGI